MRQSSQSGFGSTAQLHRTERADARRRDLRATFCIMSADPLPDIPGVEAHGLPDQAWTVEHPRWVQVLRPHFAFTNGGFYVAVT